MCNIAPAIVRKKIRLPLRTGVLPRWLGLVSPIAGIWLLIPPLGWLALIFTFPLWTTAVALLLYSRGGGVAPATAPVPSRRTRAGRTACRDTRPIGPGAPGAPRRPRRGAPGRGGRACRRRTRLRLRPGGRARRSGL